MITSKEEYYELLERLKDKNFNEKLSKHLQSKLEALQECEELINTLGIHNVSQRSKLLLDYTKKLKKQGTLTRGQDESKLVKKYLNINFKP